jgi:hypothetical protein
MIYLQSFSSLYATPISKVAETDATGHRCSSKNAQIKPDRKFSYRVRSPGVEQTIRKRENREQKTLAQHSRRKETTRAHIQKIDAPQRGGGNERDEGAVHQSETKPIGFYLYPGYFHLSSIGPRL